MIRSTHVGNETDESGEYFLGSHHHRYHHHHRHQHYRHHNHHHNHHHSSHRDNERNAHLPESIDWRNEGAVNPVVPNQGFCGACWAFATVGSIEGQYFRKTGKFVSLSVQNLLDCSIDYGYSNDCSGGQLDQAYKYVERNGGINTASSYPYEESNGFCRYKPDDSIVKISGFKRIPRGDEAKLTEAIATVGPISISIDASSRNFDLYRSGIYYDPSCSSTSLDHSVLVVGYGTNRNGEDYYIVRNSYGPNWGEGGYFKMARNKGNHCGIATEPSFPIL